MMAEIPTLYGDFWLPVSDIGMCDFSMGIRCEWLGGMGIEVVTVIGHSSSQRCLFQLLRPHFYGLIITETRTAECPLGQLTTNVPLYYFKWVNS